jgi:hypothetical protein
MGSLLRSKQFQRSYREKQELAAAAGAGTHAFAIHPKLGWPDKEWVTADPEFRRVRQRWIPSSPLGRL